MRPKNYLTFCFALVFTITFAQNNVCTSSDHEIEDLNSIGKCAIEHFKKSKKKEYVAISTRSRVVRRRKSNNILKLKKNIKAISKQKTIVERNEKRQNTLLANNTSSEQLLKSYVRFDQVTDQPVFITCSDNSISDQEECIKETISNNILENLIYPFDAASEGIEGRVWVRFIVDQEGYVKNITTSGPEKGELLEKEAKRLVNLLPKFIPGKQNENYVNVEYFIPIDFELED
ncbi:energy transducer TonB [Tenacibaculum jejuense]|uniref:TonB family protein n=1 Tax=Tenacibaculum jejuense TaxID=584609 RepID=A0A238U5X6_9FLAO|nr:energy transducer TonB [Tenacibaculum jejuense]SNR14406.1 TonB family protein precursor [Tenacibaculum jejuense]